MTPPNSPSSGRTLTARPVCRHGAGSASTGGGGSPMPGRPPTGASVLGEWSGQETAWSPPRLGASSRRNAQKGIRVRRRTSGRGSSTAPLVTESERLSVSGRMAQSRAGHRVRVGRAVTTRRSTCGTPKVRRRIARSVTGRGSVLGRTTRSGIADMRKRIESALRRTARRGGRSTVRLPRRPGRGPLRTWSTHGSSRKIRACTAVVPPDRSITYWRCLVGVRPTGRTSLRRAGHATRPSTHATCCRSYCHASPQAVTTRSQPVSLCRVKIGGTPRRDPPRSVPRGRDQAYYRAYPDMTTAAGLVGPSPPSSPGPELPSTGPSGHPPGLCRQQQEVTMSVANSRTGGYSCERTHPGVSSAPPARVQHGQVVDTRQGRPEGRPCTLRCPAPNSSRVAVCSCARPPERRSGR